MPIVVDLHSHLLPHVDDGARDLPESLAGLRALVTAGVTELAVTPHLDGSVTTHPEQLEARLSELDRGWQVLAEITGGDVRLHRGVEIMLDAPVLDLSDERVRLAGGPYALVEFAYMAVPARSGETLEAILEQGIRPIVAHPERYPQVSSDAGLVLDWRVRGAYLQLNGGSLLGRYGPSARRAALGLLEAGVIDCVASDYHARGDPGVAKYAELLVQLAGEEAADRLLAENPRRVLAGEALLSPPMATRRPLWRRIRESLP